MMTTSMIAGGTDECTDDHGGNDDGAGNDDDAGDDGDDDDEGRMRRMMMTRLLRPTMTTMMTPMTMAAMMMMTMTAMPVSCFSFSAAMDIAWLHMHSYVGRHPGPP